MRKFIDKVRVIAEITVGVVVTILTATAVIVILACITEVIINNQ